MKIICTRASQRTLFLTFFKEQLAKLEKEKQFCVGTVLRARMGGLKA